MPKQVVIFTNGIVFGSCNDGGDYHLNIIYKLAFYPKLYFFIFQLAFTRGNGHLIFFVLSRRNIKIRLEQNQSHKHICKSLVTIDKRMIDNYAFKNGGAFSTTVGYNSC